MVPKWFQATSMSQETEQKRAEEGERGWTKLNGGYNAHAKGREKRPFCWNHPCHARDVKAAFLGLLGRAPRPKESGTSCGCSGFGRLHLSGWAVRSVTGLSRSCSEPDRARC